MIMKVIGMKEFSDSKSIIFELLVITYIKNFDISRELSINICKEKLIKMEEYIKQKSAIIIGTYQDERLVGFMWLYKHDYFGELRLHINQIIVSEEFRGIGIGKELISQAELIAKEHNIKTLDLNVTEMNKEAAGIYRSMGFITERRYMKKAL